LRKVLHANDDNVNLGGAFLIAYRVEKYLREYGFSYDYVSMDHFSNENNPFKIPEDDITYSAYLRNNRFLGHIKLPFYINRVLKNNNYKIIHIDTDAAWKGLLYAVPAKKNNVKVLLHSHSTGIDGQAKGIKSICEFFAKKMLPKYVDKYIACSNEAREWMAPNGDIEKIEFVFNGIDYNEFYFSESEREEYRSRLQLNECLVLGNVAALMERKNQRFIIEIFNEIHKKISNSKLLLVGDDKGSYGDQCKDLVGKYGLNDCVYFIGISSNIREILNAMDVFVIPSFFEGAPLSLYEAEATGVVCIASDSISKDAVICEWCSQYSLKKPVGEWADKIIELYSNTSNEREKRRLPEKYSIKNMASILSDIYSEMETDTI